MLEHFEKFESYIPFDLNQSQNILIAFVVMYLVIVFRYLLLVGTAHWYFWYIKKDVKKLFNKNPSKKQIYYELKWSLISSLFFAFAGVLIGLMWQNGYTPMYLKLGEFGIWYLLVSFILTALLHEIYFYFTHRLLHVPWLYKRAHQTHHNSVNPSAWASLSFHPIEAFLESMVLPLILVIIPMHPLVLLNYLLFMTVSAIINHLGIEVFTGKLAFVRKFFITGTHHHLHHSKFNYNYGLYFTFMDALFKTEFKTEFKK
jgi:lathosterol oxidase